VFNWPADGKLFVPGLKNRVRKAWLLASPGKALGTENTGDGWMISVPKTAPDGISSTVVLQITGAPEIESPRITQDFDGTVILRADEARFHGEQIRFESGPDRNCIAFWTNPEDWVDWEIEISKPGRFDVTAEVAALEGAGLEVTIGNQKTTTNVGGTADYGKFRTARLGSLEIPSAGTNVILSLHAVRDNWHPLNVRAVRLRPSRPQ
jgi:alpha-L-fucosidase